MNKKTFSGAELRDFLDGDKTKFVLVREDVVDSSRWSIIKRLLFREIGQDESEAWLAHYSVGATELQSEGPFEYEDTVECALLKKTERAVAVWDFAETNKAELLA